MSIGYETMFILQPGLEPEAEEEIVNNLKILIEKQKGEIKEIEDMGVRRLAYEINKFKEGHYFLLKFESGPRVIPELEHFFRVTDRIMRYLVIREKG